MYCLSIVYVLSELYCVSIVYVLSELYCVTTVWLLSEYCLCTDWAVLCEYCLCTFWATLCKYFMCTNRGLFDLHHLNQLCCREGTASSFVTQISGKSAKSRPSNYLRELYSRESMAISFKTLQSGKSQQSKLIIMSVLWEKAKTQSNSPDACCYGHVHISFPDLDPPHLLNLRLILLELDSLLMSLHCEEAFTEHAPHGWCWRPRRRMTSYCKRCIPMPEFQRPHT